MSDVIQLLPDSVANQIAAGEVIQRPANVIKELVENSVDAGATVINVLVVDAGRTSIQVIDNGVGMSETDARLAFERHATSKIRKAADLFALNTMGFRGEALPSIAAVSVVELRTRKESSELGTELILSGSKLQSQRPCACTVGCNFKVENIFFNVPARRKFLKSNSTELNNILTAFERIALVYPEITFTFHSNGGEVFNLKAGNTHKRIADIFGKKLSQDLLPVEVHTTICNITGFVGRPESAKKKCTQQYFFVNGRFMKHPYFAKAVQTAFERLVPAGEQVPFFLYFDVEPSDIDVNIHPAKTEIKFENEQSIWQILAAAIREAVGVFNEVPTIDFDNQGKPEMPIFDTSKPIDMPVMNFNPAYNPFKADTKPKKESVAGWENLYAGNIPSQLSDDDLFGSAIGNTIESNISVIDDKASTHYQYKGQYIVTSVKGGLMLIDQYRAHVRILYEEYVEQMKNKQVASQRMLFPEAVQFKSCEIHLLDRIIDEMTNMGFELTPLGALNYAINSVPAGLEGINPSTLVADMVTDVIQAGTAVKDDIVHTLALSMARKAAVPKGQVLVNEEMENIITRLFSCSNNNYTPDGKKIYALITQEDIDHFF